MTATSSPRARLARLASALTFACYDRSDGTGCGRAPDPQIGSSNPITAEPPVARPHTHPCVVQLFNNLAFADFTPKVFNYTPPSACPGPWAKVVFTADFTVTAGRQFDRTAAFYLGHASIYYGTTAEPRKTLSPSWHVERDVTDLTRDLQVGADRRSQHRQLRGRIWRRYLQRHHLCQRRARVLSGRRRSSRAGDSRHRCSRQWIGRRCRNAEHNVIADHADAEPAHQRRARLSRRDRAEPVER